MGKEPPIALRPRGASRVGSSEVRDVHVEIRPLHTAIDVEEIAAGAVYLASPASGYTTGSVLDIDGGVQRSNLDMNIPDL